jgi:translation initiation factor IF-2
MPDYIKIRDLAGLLGVKPFRVVAEMLELRIFKHADEVIDFSTASRIAQRHGFIVERLLRFDAPP